MILTPSRIETMSDMTVLISDYFQGKTLQQLQKEEGARSFGSTLEIAKSIVKALEDAEAKGLFMDS